MWMLSPCFRRYSYVFTAAGIIGFLVSAAIMWWVRSHWIAARREPSSAINSEQPMFNHAYVRLFMGSFQVNLDSESDSEPKVQRNLFTLRTILDSNAGPGTCRRMISMSDTTSAQASFVAGNVWFEIRYSDRSLEEWVNYYYFSLLCITLVLGGLVVVLSQAINVAYVNLPSESSKMTFCRGLNTSRAMFALFNSSQYVWLLSLLALGYTKYMQHWQFSFAWALFGLATLSSLWFVLRALWAMQRFNQPTVRAPVVPPRRGSALDDVGAVSQWSSSGSDEAVQVHVRVTVSEMVPLQVAGPAATRLSSQQGLGEKAA